MKCQNTTVPKFFRLFRTGSQLSMLHCTIQRLSVRLLSNHSRSEMPYLSPTDTRQQQNADPFRFADVTDALVFFLNFATDVFFRFSINRYDSKPALFQFFSKYTTEIFP